MARRKKAATKRGSPEAIAKRKVARALNQLFSEAGESPLDGRTLKRKRRLIEQLTKGKHGKPLKALEVLVHANELLSLGESLSSLRKLKPQLPATPPVTEEATAIYLETQKNYGFDPKAWRLLGIDIAGLADATKGTGSKKRSTRRRRG